jgi:hypothetical protein
MTLSIMIISITNNQLNDTQHYDNQHNTIQHNYTQHNNIMMWIAMWGSSQKSPLKNDSFYYKDNVLLLLKP